MSEIAFNENHEYCTRCEADLTMQKGFSSDLPYWVCRGCGEVLINPDNSDDVVWVCDGCGAILNSQEGFDSDCGQWTCSECGFINNIASEEIYLSEEEYQASLHNVYNGMAEADMLKLMEYEEMETVNGHDNVFLVRNPESGELFIKKILSTYDSSVYRYLQKHPIEHMPAIYGVYEGSNRLVVIEEYIEGISLSELIEKQDITAGRAIEIAYSICSILRELHNPGNTIIHRDIKPSNIIQSADGEIYLLDMNAAKWYREDETEDTRMLGTENYAAPEQLGYGLSASSAKTDIYALGILLNVMLTGSYPKEKRAEGPVWEIIQKCISLEAANRYSDDELLEALDSYRGA